MAERLNAFSPNAKNAEERQTVLSTREQIREEELALTQKESVVTK